ncbi:hypothetical protein SSTU70S_05718 [Stutzerimonas stutzeri]
MDSPVMQPSISLGATKQLAQPDFDDPIKMDIRSLDTMLRYCLANNVDDLFLLVGAPWAVMWSEQVRLVGQRELYREELEQLLVTTDLASVQMVDGELLINHELSGTEKVGVLDAKATLDELVRSHLAKEGVKGATGHGSKLPDALVSNILQNGSASYSGQRWDFTLQRDQACQVVAERVTSYIQSSVGNVHTYLAILVVGGGAIVFKEWLNKILPNAIFLDEFANARGALKFLRDNRNQAAG